MLGDSLRQKKKKKTAVSLQYSPLGMFVQKYLAARREGCFGCQISLACFRGEPQKIQAFLSFFFFSCVLPEKEIIAVETGDKYLGVTKAMQEIKVMRKMYSRTPLFRSPKGNEKKFEIAGLRNNRGSVKGKGKSKGIRSSFEIAGTSN